MWGKVVLAEQVVAKRALMAFLEPRVALAASVLPGAAVLVVRDEEELSLEPGVALSVVAEELRPVLADLPVR